MGALPSGGDPTQFALGDFGMAGAGLSGLANITQEVVQQFYNSLATNNETLQNMSDLVFQGLNSALGLPLAILTALIERLFPFVNIPSSMDELLEIIPSVPILGDLVELLTGVEDGDLNDLGTMFLNVRKLFEGLNFLDGSFNPLAAWQTIAQTLLDPVGLFAKLIDLNTLASGIADALNSIPLVGPILGGIVNTVWGVISALIGQGTSNSNDIAVLNSVVLTPSSGMGWVDEFNDPQSYSLDPTKYTQTVVGGGGGHFFGTGGNGRSFWYTGSGYIAIRYVRNTPATSAKQYASVVLAQSIVDARPPGTFIYIRSDATANNCIVLAMYYNLVSLLAVVGGVQTTIASWGGNYNPGDKFELFGGTGADIRKYLVKRNGATVPGMDWVSEPGAISDTSLLLQGVGQESGNNFFLLSIGAPQLATISGGDYA